ncbi:MAG TPA: hemerythrin family protein [Candidatus Treponema faecavium]|nr:hemerythrin family protein [Candidatus Treponema faecavium]
MKHIPWNDLYLVGHELIDLQHKKLFEIAERMYVLILERRLDAQELKHIIADLSDYAKYHFSCEEMLMQEVQFPFIRSHRQQHIKINERVAATIQDFENGIDIDIEQLYLFLVHWLVDHITLMDKQIAMYIQKLQ